MLVCIIAISLSKSVFVKSPQSPKPALLIKKSISFTFLCNSLQFSSIAKSMAMISILTLYISNSFFNSCNRFSSLAANIKS